MTGLDPSVFEAGWRARGTTMSDAAWLVIAHQAVEFLGAILRRRIQVDEKAVSVREGFSVDFRTDDEDPTLWDLRVRGTVGADIVDDRLLVRGWLCLYSGDRRIAPDGAEFFHVELVREQAQETWRRVGWRRGEPGEFDSFAAFR